MILSGGLRLVVDGSALGLGICHSSQGPRPAVLPAAVLPTSGQVPNAIAVHWDLAWEHDFKSHGDDWLLQPCRGLSWRDGQSARLNGGEF
eukprot:6167148-Pyramimonas_sp.AAC.1